MSLRLRKRMPIQDALAAGLVCETGHCIEEAPIVATPALCEEIACAGGDVADAMARIALGAWAAVEAETRRTGRVASSTIVRLNHRRDDGRQVPVLASVPWRRGRYVLMLDGE